MLARLRGNLERNKIVFFGVLILVFFFTTHLSGIHSPYHQDEYKWVYYSHPEIIAPGTVPHPPLTEFLYTTFGPMVGDNNFRSIPFFFGTLNLFLVFYLTKLIFDKKTALWASGLFAVSFYSLLASLMVDVDGAVMPFFFLVMLIGYYKLKLSDFRLRAVSWSTIALILIGAVGGFLVKVVFVLPIAVLALDYALSNKTFSDKKKLFKFFSYGLVGLGILVIVLISSKFIFPSFNLSYSLKYWEHFANFTNRGWFQTFIQFSKAILYSSPLLLAPLLFIDKETIKKTRPLLIFLAVEVLFYLFVFDFSIGALDRYFQFIVIPLCIISAAVFNKIMDESGRIKKSQIVAISIVAITIFCFQFLLHHTPSLYPKSEWVSRVLSLKWNFLYPFSGGSGPLGFYVSFIFMAISWLAALCGVFWAFWKPQYKKVIVVFLIVIGVVYNGVFIEEYLFGFINGSASNLLYKGVEFLKNSPSIPKVTVYNDNGGYEVQSIGKYQRRLYIAPYFTGQFEYLNENKGYYFVINIPTIDPTSFYIKYFDTCKVVYSDADKKITSTIYDCRGAPDITH